MKKAISLSLVVVMLFALCITTFMSVSAEGATINGISANQGDKVTVKYYVASDSKWEDFQGEFVYDYTGLRLNGFEMCTMDGVITNTSQFGFVFYNGTNYSKPYNFTKETLFCTAEFTVLSDGEYTVANNWTVVDDVKSQPIVNYGPAIDGRLTDRMEITVTPKPTESSNTKPSSSPTKPSSSSSSTATSPITPPTPFPGSVESITLSKDSASVYTGQTVSLTATVAPDTAGNKAVEWTTSNSRVATVSDKGVVKGVGKGTATITATAKDGSGVKAFCTVTVRQSVTSITMKKTAAVYTGQKITLKATVSPSSAYNKTLLWSSSQKSVAKVTSAGVVSGLKAGKTNIKAATSDGSRLYSTCKVTVRQAVKKITLSKKKIIVKKGNKVKVKAMVDKAAYNKKMTVKAVNSKIVKVSSKTAKSGKAVTITGLNKGNTKVKFTAMDGSKKSATCSVRVN